MLRSLFFSFAILAAGTLFAYDNGVVPVNTKESAKRLIDDLMQTYGAQYPKGSEYLRRLESVKDQKELDQLIREAALANPLLDFDKILCVRRKPNKWRLGFIELNAYTNDTIPRKGWDNEIVMLSNLRTEPKLTSVYRHNNDGILRDLDLYFDCSKILFASVNDKGNWAVFEVGLDGKNLRELSPSDQNDVQWFDPCYLAEENAILSFSTAGMQGVPCVAGSQKVASLYRIDSDENGKPKKVRQLTFEQDSGWHPRLLNDGRAMYLRWQYTETPHYFDRILFTMAPDGRQQRALWGSGAFFPTAYKHCRPVLTHPSMVLGVVSGHHSLPEAGRLLLVDPNLGTHYPFRHDPQTKEWGIPGTHADLYPRVYPKEVTGCVQEIPGWGRDVIGNVMDNQGGTCKYTFAMPFPLNEKYFLVSMWLDHQGTYGLWLVDVFDNMVKLYDLPDAGIYEPIPLIERKRPPIRPDLTDPNAKTGTIFITDIYEGRGLNGIHGDAAIPRGKAKSLRVFAYHWAYWRTGNYEAMGEHSGYDIKRILGTVPIEEDGSVAFHVPANTPIAFHVLDEEGAALQIMQSWTIAMPGEGVSCTGCHEKTSDVTPSKNTIASRKPPREITPFYGAARPYGFVTEVQPILDKHCVKCHNDANKQAAGVLSFTANNGADWRQNKSYESLHPFIRRPGTEYDIATKTPMDFHASTSELVRLLRRGHYNVKMEREDWDKLYTWIDLNVPYRAAWNNSQNEARRLELQKLYAGIETNPEEEARALAALAAPKVDIQPVPAEEIKKLLKPVDRTEVERYKVSIGTLPSVKGDNVKVQGFPFHYRDAVRKQKEIEKQMPVIEVEGIRFIPIPAGEFVMGSIDGFDDERPRTVVKIEKPFWIAETEITNRQYAAFDPVHDTGYEGEAGFDHVTPGYIANHPDQPAARVSWLESKAFCGWLTKKIGEGKTVTLPTEAQWEWAARGGTETAFYFGHRWADFSDFANLADGGLRKTWQRHNSGQGQYEWNGLDARYPQNFTKGVGSSNFLTRGYYPLTYPFPLRDDRFTDKWFTVDYVKQYQPNPWGLYDMIGNVWEWTQSDAAAYPYVDNDGRNKGDVTVKKIVRGGSHADRPKIGGSAARLPYEPFQKIHDVGFRPIIVDMPSP